MSPLLRPVFQSFRRFRWRMTLSYLLVTLAALFILAWWGLIAGAVYLQRSNPTLTWQQVFQTHLLPALGAILPSLLLLLIPAVLVSVFFGYLTARWLEIRLNTLRQTVQAWQAGNFTVKVLDDVSDEIGWFGQSLNSMAEEMEHLLRARSELAALEERHHLARDLHDSVKQQLTAASFQLAAAAALLERNPQAAAASLAEAEKLNLAAGKELNAIIFQLRPVALKPGGLEQSLREFLDDWQRQNQVEVGLRCTMGGPVSAQVQQELIRFVQEALSNVARHSQATRVEMMLASGAAELELSISDNGRGFAAGPDAESGFGLQTMRERIQQVGGSFELESLPGQGTRILVHVRL